MLGDFVTQDQAYKWPKYIVLEEKLIDKLELVMQTLNARGVRATGAVILSGFRAPYYNERGVGEGMARASRHQYGDAADLIIDSNGDGRMDDLSGDGRIDLRDAEVVSLRGDGSGAESSDSSPVGWGATMRWDRVGPFAHIDVRGTSARWESGWWKKEERG